MGGHRGWLTGSDRPRPCEDVLGAEAEAAGVAPAEADELIDGFIAETTAAGNFPTRYRQF